MWLQSLVQSGQPRAEKSLGRRTIVRDKTSRPLLLPCAVLAGLCYLYCACALASELAACKTLGKHYLRYIYEEGRAEKLIPSRRHVMRREERLGVPGGFVEGTTRRGVVVVQPLGRRSRVLRVVVVDRRCPAAPRRPRGGPRRALFVHRSQGAIGPKLVTFFGGRSAPGLPL